MEQLTFSQHMLGEHSLVQFMAGMLFALIGAYVSLYLHSMKRNKLDPDTPYKFSFSFMTLDNAMRLFSNMVVTFIALRFSGEIFGKEFSMFYAFLIGACFDNVLYGLQKLQDQARK